MPTTYNGIGTHYYGKRNIQKRPGPCPHCGRPVELTSYDTRLWFVVFFIPIVPLGRKRIVDYCPTCTRHFAMDADKWETAKQLEVSGALDNYRANPTPEDAIATHQQMLNFHQLQQAAEFRKTMREKFADNAKVQAYLGAALEHFGQFDEANDAFARARALRSDLPEARVGVAHGHIRAGRLDEARRLLDFLEKPGAAQLYSLEPLETLAHACQNAGRHQDALDLFAKLQEALPKIAEHKGFRALVKKSEKAIGRKESQLPRLKFSWKRLFTLPAATAGSPQVTWRSLLVVGILLALVALGFVIANEYIRRHRTLHIVNGYPQPATVQISGVAELKNVRGVRDVVLAEGRHRAVIRGPVTQEVDFEVRSRYFSRWFSDPAWVLNLGGAAVLIRSEVVYSRNPPPPTITFHFGKCFERFERVTHPFETLPESLRMKEHEQRTLAQLELFHGDGTDLFTYHLGRKQVAAALDFAETWLRGHAGDEQVLRLYASTAHRQHETNRLENFVRAGLAERPVRIEWHRVHQGLRDNPAGHAALVAEYDALLRADPQNSALLYLRGRIDGDRATCRDFFERAARADPDNAYAVFGLGFDRMIVGDWAAARPLFARACALRPTERTFEHWLRIIRFALAEAPALEQEARRQIGTNAVDFQAATQLVDALAAQDRRADALEACATFERACAGKFGKEGRGVAGTLRRHALYAIGDFNALEKDAAGDSSPSGRTAQAEALIEQGRVADAVKLLPAETDDDRPAVMLALALASRLAGDASGAARWQEQARQLLANGNEDQVRAAVLLGRTMPPTLAEAQDLAIPPQLKAVLLANLALQYPQARAELAPLARRLNVERTFPFHLVQRATAEAR